MAIIIERTITINNDKATLDKPIYFYIGDGNITCLFTIKEIEKTARFGKINDSNIIQENDSIDYGEARIYKPSKDHAETTRAEIIDDKLQIEFNFDNIDEYSEAGIHKLQIHLYDNATGDRNRLTIPPIDIHVLYPIGVENSLIDEAIVDYSLLEAINEDVSTFDEEGNYNKTEWEKGDIITKEKLNKIEDALYEINAADSNFVTNEALETELANKANIVHTHTGYATTSQLSTKANTNHTHTGYATTSHTHSNYAMKTDLQNINVPTKTSQLTNDSGFITNANIPTKTSQLINDSDFITNANMPAIPTNVSAFTNDSEYVTKTNLVNYNYISETEARATYATHDYVVGKINEAKLDNGETSAPDLSAYALKSDIPTKTSQLTNNSGFITNEALIDYATIDYVDESVRDINGGNANINDNSISINTVYSSSKVHDLVTQLSASDSQLNDDLVDMDTRLIYVEAEIAAIKDNSQDPSGDESGYITQEELESALSNKADIVHTHDDYALKSEIPNITGVPTNVSAFTNDAGYITSSGTMKITKIEIVEVLPDYEDPTVLYIVMK